MPNFQRDHRKNKQSHQCRCCHPSKYEGNGGTLRAGREKLCVPRVILMQQEAISLLSQDDENPDEDWVADTSTQVGSQVQLAAIIFSLAKPERLRRRGLSRRRSYRQTVTHTTCKGAARDFVMVPTVKRVQHLDDDVFDDLYLDDNDEWEILDRPPLARSYAAAAHP